MVGQSERGQHGRLRCNQTHWIGLGYWNMRSNVSRCDGYTARSSRFPCIRRLLNACPIETLALLQGATSPDGWTREREAVGGVDKKAISFPFAIPVFRRAESGKIAYWIPAMEAHDESR